LLRLLRAIPSGWTIPFLVFTVHPSCSAIHRQSRFTHRAVIPRTPLRIPIFPIRCLSTGGEVLKTYLSVASQKVCISARSAVAATALKRLRKIEVRSLYPSLLSLYAFPHYTSRDSVIYIHGFTYTCVYLTIVKQRYLTT
jgi:hypothetical protein